MWYHRKITFLDIEISISKRDNSDIVKTTEQYSHRRHLGFMKFTESSLRVNDRGHVAVGIAPAVQKPSPAADGLTEALNQTGLGYFQTSHSCQLIRQNLTSH